MIVPTVVQQHADDAALQGMHRAAMVEGPTATLPRLHRFDRRLAANFEGLRIAGEEGWALCEAALENPSHGSLFVVAVRALEDHDRARLDRAIAIAHVVEAAGEGLLASFEWVDRPHLQGTVASLLRDVEGFKRMVGIAACAVHRVDFGIAAGHQLGDPDAPVRARAFRAAGELGAAALSGDCTAAADDDEELEVRFWSAWSSVLLGDRHLGLDALTTHALSSGVHRGRAFRLALQAMSDASAQDLLQQIARDPHQLRWLVEGSGIAGNVRYVPWLMRQMEEPKTSRLAGEAFALITGADLPQDALDRPAHEAVESGPIDDPNDPEVKMDPDEGMPWPDAPRIESWWAANSTRFHPGLRYFMGAPVTREHCIHVLKNGYQRQRILAAHYLCLLQPGTPLFNTSAPAWRQQRLLAHMA